ncbi:hypothetical protein NPIL_503031 [Nephila pilipes]|uniref:Uncharacterized protein n=1 Tax=Nephila pilipes TaxID=299642 RepID=A0A8X6P433_NEPPI|nr:hypothetical protein NPIL_503031 [Nephila pilipes]
MQNGCTRYTRDWPDAINLIPLKLATLCALWEPYFCPNSFSKDETRVVLPPYLAHTLPHCCRKAATFAPLAKHAAHRLATNKRNCAFRNRTRPRCEQLYAARLPSPPASSAPLRACCKAPCFKSASCTSGLLTAAGRQRAGGWPSCRQKPCRNSGPLPPRRRQRYAFYRAGGCFAAFKGATALATAGRKRKKRCKAFAASTATFARCSTWPAMPLWPLPSRQLPPGKAAGARSARS